MRGTSAPLGDTGLWLRPQSGWLKITGQICLTLIFSVSALESNSLAGYFRHNRSNLCTRHIQKKLTPRGHHDWPVMPTIRTGSTTRGTSVGRTFARPSGLALSEPG